jgi:hypothetical protein
MERAGICSECRRWKDRGYKVQVKDVKCKCRRWEERVKDGKRQRMQCRCKR